MPHPRAALSTAETRLLARLADELGNGLKQLAARYVADSRAGGATWNEIGRSFGVTAQSAHQRFGKPTAEQQPRAESHGKDSGKSPSGGSLA